MPHRCRLICFLFLSFIACRHQQEFKAKAPLQLSLTKGWRFKTGDSIDYTKADPGDPGWKPIEPGKDWHSLGYPDHYGYAGYMLKTIIPSSLKAGWDKDSVKINLGFIAFYDQTFLNGHLLGENSITFSDTAKDIPDFRSKFPGLFLPRCYKIAAGDSRIHWDQENTIAVRVFSDLDNGGLWGGEPGIVMEGMNDFVVFDRSRFYAIVDQKRLDTLLVVRNTHPKLSFTGDIILSAEDTLTKKEIFHYEKIGLKLSPKDTLAIPVSLETTMDPIKFYSEFRETRLQLLVSDSTDIPFVLEK